MARVFPVALLLLATPLPAQTPLPRANFITVQDGQFSKMDADKDGNLTRIEVDEFQKMTAVATGQQRNRALFAQLDADKNGQISPAEFLKLPLGQPETNPAPFMAQMDGNRDGKVTLIEHRTGTLANFDRLDTDKDGIVTPAEMKAGGIAPR
jgi:hypothetical protein